MLTNQQARVLDFIDAWVQFYGRPPSYEQIGRVLGRSTSRVHQIVQSLQAAGYLEIDAGKRRTIRITSKGQPQHRGATVLVSLY